MHRVCLLVSLVLVPSLSSGALMWERITFTGSGPPARRDAAIGWDSTRGRLFVFGGRSGATQFGDTWMYTIATRTWSQLPQATLNGQPIPEKRFTIVFGTWNDSLYITTGEGKSSTGAREFYNDVYRLNFANLEWTRIAVASGDPPRIRYGASGGIHPDGHYFFVTHGFSGTRWADTFKLDLRVNRWTRAHGDIHPYEPFNPHARCLQSGIMLTTKKMLMYGGCASGGKTGGPCPSQDNWLFDDSKSEWTELSTCASPRIYSAMSIFPTTTTGGKSYNVAVLYGGGESNDEVIEVTKAPADEVTVFDAATEEWSRRRVLPDATHNIPAKRLGHVMVTVSNGIMMFGGQTDKATNELWLLKGNAKDALDSVSPGGCQGRMTNYIMVHGIFMFFGWGLFLQLGSFLARYLRGHDPLWFHLHRIFNMTGMILAIIALPLGIVSVRFDHFTFAHGIIGLDVMIAGIFQSLSIIKRPHKDPSGDKSALRRIWEVIHKGSGRIALLLAIVNITLGLFLAVSHTAIWGVWLAYVCVLVLIYVIAEVRLWMRSDEKSMGMEMSRK